MDELCFATCLVTCGSGLLVRLFSYRRLLLGCGFGVFNFSVLCGLRIFILYVSFFIFPQRGVFLRCCFVTEYIVNLLTHSVNLARCGFVKFAHAYAFFFADGSRKKVHEVVVCCNAADSCSVSNFLSFC